MARTFHVTDDDGATESGHPPDPGSGLSATPDPAPGLGRAPEQPPPGTPGTPATRGPRGTRRPRIPLPGFGVAHPGTAPSPGPATGSSADPGAILPPDAAAAPPGPPSAGPGIAAPAPSAARPPSAGRAAGPGVTAPTDGTTPPLDIDQIASQVYERIGDKMDHRPDTAQDTPPAEQAIMLRDKAPELYDLWLKIAQEKAATINYVQRAPYEVPERLAQSGRPRALSAMIVVLAFCGYLASLGGPGPYIGGLIAIADLLVMLALFFGLRPDHLTDSSRPRKRRLIRAGRTPAPQMSTPDELGPQAPDTTGGPGLISDTRAPARSPVMALAQLPGAPHTGSGDVLLPY